MKYLQDRSPAHVVYESAMHRYNAGLARLEDVHEYIVKSKISNQVLRMQDISKVVNTLVHDGSVERRTRDGQDMYKVRPVPSLMPTPGVGAHAPENFGQNWAEGWG